MVITKMSELGERISHNGNDKLEPALGDGTTKAGMWCGIDPADGKAKAGDGDSATLGLYFNGLCDRDPTLGIDVAITNGKPLNLIQPVSGKEYSVFIEDPTATFRKGAPVTLGATTAGSFMVIAKGAAAGAVRVQLDLTGNAQTIVTQPIYGYLADDIINTQTACKIVWA